MVDINITLVWQLINFLVVYLLLNHLFFKPLLKVMDERKARLRGLGEGYLDEKEALAALEGQYKRKVGSIHGEAARLRKAARDSAGEERRAIIAKAEAEAAVLLEKKVENLERDFTELETSLVGEIPDVQSVLTQKLLN